MTRELKPMDIKERHRERREKRIRQQKRRRIVFFSVIALILILILMYCTPIFNVRNVKVEGLLRVSNEQLSMAVGDLVGENLFSVRSGKIEKAVRKLAYVSDVNVKKKLIPPSLVVSLEECVPLAYIEHNEEMIIIDANAKVLETVTETDENIPVVNGVTVISYQTGEKLSIDDDKQKLLISVMADFKEQELIPGVTRIELGDISNIIFNYESRLDGVCGSYIDFKSKLGFFKEAIARLAENARGTIDLSTTGKAVYRP